MGVDCGFDICPPLECTKANQEQYELFLREVLDTYGDRTDKLPPKTMLACNEFHLFPSLPSEIRLKIWSIALSVSRNVYIQPRSPRSVRSFSPKEPPALLQVCRESRLETLQIYKPFFRPDPILKNIYVSFSQDTIITSERFDIMWMAELQGIQKIKIKINSIHRFIPFGITALKKMQPDLRELELVFEQRVIYGSPQRVTDDIRDRITQGWDCCPDMKIVDRQTGGKVWILGRSSGSQRQSTGRRQNTPRNAAAN